MEPDEGRRFACLQLYFQVAAERRAGCPRMRETWEWFDSRFGPLIARYARHITWVEPEARVQELWIFLTPRLLKLDHDSSRCPLAPRIALLVRRAVSDARRAARARHPEPWDPAALPDLPDPAYDALTCLERQELREGVHVALAELCARGEADHVELLVCHWIDGVRFTTIAAATGRTAAQVRFQHIEARRQLRAIFSQRRLRDLVPDDASRDPLSGKS